MQPLYNRDGRAVAYISDNNVSLYFYDGSPAGWIYQGSLVYAYSGRFLGWLMYGWLCDPRGNPSFFTDRSTGGPKRAARQTRPVRAPRGPRPSRRRRQSPPSRPGLTTTWSEISDESFFAAGPVEPGAPMEEDDGGAAETPDGAAETPDGAAPGETAWADTAAVTAPADTAANAAAEAAADAAADRAGPPPRTTTATDPQPTDD